MRDVAASPSSNDTHQSTRNTVSSEAQFVPGRMRCAKCNFILTRVNLYVQSGQVGAGDNKTELCGNGCGPMWPVTWEQEAREGYKANEALFERMKAAEDALAAISPPRLVAAPIEPTGIPPAEVSDLARALIAKLENAAVQYDSNKRAGLGVLSGWRLSEARDALRAALRHQPASAALPLQPIGFANRDEIAELAESGESSVLIRKTPEYGFVIALYTSAPSEPATTQEASAGKTGWPPGLLQDDSKGLSKWLASKPDAKLRAREAVAPLSGAGETLTESEILESAKDPMTRPCSPWWLQDGVILDDVRNAAIVFARAIIAKLDAKRGRHD